MARSQMNVGRQSDRNVRAALGFLLLTAACSSPTRSGSPTGGLAGTPRPGAHGFSDARAVDRAYMFVDRPAVLALSETSVNAPATTPAAADGADFSVTVGVTTDGTMAGTAIAPPPSCVTPPEVAAIGRNRVVPTDYATIQAAVDAADPGDVVLVQPGVYHESVRLKSNVSLVGSGAADTILDARGEGVSLIDFTGARNVVVQGFTLTGVGLAKGCSQPDDPFWCSGNWYAAAIYGDGSETDSAHVYGRDPCADTSILVTQNVVRDNAIGMMSYFHARAVVRNNVFVGNTYAFVANSLQDHALVLYNAFVANGQEAIGSQAAYLDVVGNIITGSAVGVQHEFIQTGRISCNFFAQVGTPGERVPIGEQGNLTLGTAFVDAAHGDFRPTAELIAAAGACLDTAAPDVVSWTSAEPGAFGGVLGRWTTD